MKVESSWITDVFYSGEDGILRVVLKNGSAYEFKHVSLSTWVDLVQTSKSGGSIGFFICTRIMNNSE